MGCRLYFSSQISCLCYYDPLCRNPVLLWPSTWCSVKAHRLQTNIDYRGLRLRSPCPAAALRHGPLLLDSSRMHGFDEFQRKRRVVLARGFDPRNNGGSEGAGAAGRTVLNLAGAGLLTYLTLTGGLNWLFEALFSLWIFIAIMWWLAERNLIKGLCPNCGGEFQVFEFSMKEQPRLCPYCTQPFKLENKQFVREEPQFSNQQRQGFKHPFRGFESRSKEPFGSYQQTAKSGSKEKTPGIVVDIEAEVRDKD